MQDNVMSVRQTSEHAATMSDSAAAAAAVCRLAGCRVEEAGDVCMSVGIRDVPNNQSC